MIDYKFSLLFLWAFFIADSLAAQRSIKSMDAVEIGGINQRIAVNGKDETKPLLLFIHGGPGFSSKYYSKKFVKYLSKDFVVVQWDQRESGTTKYWNSIKEPLTLEMFHNDTYEVVQYLLKRFEREKVFLVGYSWGGMLGLQFAYNHPELLYAYISVSSIIHGQESDQLTLEMLREKAEISKNEKALEEIEKIQIPYTNWEQLFFQRKWTAFFMNGNNSKRSYPASLFQTWSQTFLTVYNEASQVNFFDTVPEIRCPIYFFVSDKDYVSNHTTAEKYYHHLKADKKQIIWFNKSTHEIPSQEAEKFSEEIIKIGESIKN